MRMLHGRMQRGRSLRARMACGLACAALLAGLATGGASAEEPAASTSRAPAKDPAAASWKDVPLSKAAQRGIKWLIVNQNADGGWGQDGRLQRSGQRTATSASDVGNTSLAMLAIMATGSRPGSGTFQGPLQRAVDFILREYGTHRGRDLAITGRQGTQLQGKIGRYADTFLAARALLDVHGRMPDKAGNTRVRLALEDILARIQRHQGADGSWNGAQGWAPIHSTAYASQALHLARARGFDVEDSVLRKVERFTIRQLKEQARQARGSPPAKKKRRRGGRDPVVTPSGGPEGVDLGSLSIGGAGVLLYSISQGYEQLTRTPASRRAHAKEIAQIQQKVSQKQVMNGFGSMGGEEFISYANLAVGMARVGTRDAHAWNANLVQRMERLQNRDGSWAGHHCITGRTAVTGLAVLTLTAERQVPRPAR